LSVRKQLNMSLEYKAAEFDSGWQAGRIRSHLLVSRLPAIGRRSQGAVTMRERQRRTPQTSMHSPAWPLRSSIPRINSVPGVTLGLALSSSAHILMLRSGGSNQAVRSSGLTGAGAAWEQSGGPRSQPDTKSGFAISSRSRASHRLGQPENPGPPADAA